MAEVAKEAVGEPGGITPVPNWPNSILIDDLARFAVDEYNNTSNDNNILEFVKVLDAKQQIVEGTMYYITLEATIIGRKEGSNDRKNENYEAKVWVKEWENFKKLESFKKLKKLHQEN